MNNKLKLAICTIIAINLASYTVIDKENDKKIEIAKEKNRDNKRFKDLYNKRKDNNKILKYKIEELIDKEVKKERIQVKKIKQKNKERISRGGLKNYTKIKRVKCIITYYTNKNDVMQGGQSDKLGKPLISHNEPIVALPCNIPYGSYLLLDEKINGSTKFKNVDTGGMIKWLDDTTMKVDVFIPNVSVEWIVNNKENKTVWGILYYK